MKGRSIILALALLCVAETWGQAPLRFVENRGQWPQAVEFMAEMPGMTAWVEQGSILLDLTDRQDLSASCNDGPHCRPEVIHHHAVRLKFVGAQASAGTGELQQRGYYNYFLGNDRSKWASRVNGYGQLVQHNVYPGVDLRVKGQQGELKYDLVLAPHADPKDIRMVYHGADNVALHGDQLRIKTSVGTIREHIPMAYQMIGGIQHEVECTYSLQGVQVGFVIGDHDPEVQLVIDPTLSFSTFSGSVTDNFGYTATFDAEGFLYSGSSAFGNQYPTSTGAYDTSHNGGDGLGDGTDIALTKYDTTGTFLVWSTYLGGSGDDLPHSLVTNSNDELFVLGTTGSGNFPMSGTPNDNTFGGGSLINPAGLGISYPNGSDMIISRISSNGSALLASTYVGGTSNDGLNTAPDLKFNYADEIRGEILLDDAEDPYIVSCTQSTDITTTPGAYQPLFAGGTHDGIVMKFTDDLSTIVWSTFIGGSGADALYSMDFASNGDIYIGGGTNSTNLFTSAGVVGAIFNGGNADAYVARLTSDGGGLTYASYWGSSNYDQAYFVELDNVGQVHLYGQTEAPSGNMVFNALYNEPTSGQFLTKLSPDLTSLTWSTRFGTGSGSPDISPTALLVDFCNKIYIAGWGSPVQGNLSTTGLEITPATAFQDSTTGGDFYLAVFEDDMSALDYATYYGGNISAEHVDGGTSRFDRRGRVYQSVCAGCGGNSDFPIEPNPGAWSATNNSTNCNNGVFKFDFEAPLVIAEFDNPFQVCANDAVPFNNLSNGAVNYLWDFGDTNTSVLSSPTHTYATPGTYTVTLIANNSGTCNLTDTVTATVEVLPAAPLVDAGNDTTFCGPNTITLIANSSGTGTLFHWSSFPDLSDMLNATSMDSTATLTIPTPGTYYVEASNGGCTSVDSIQIGLSLISAAISGDASICADDTATITLTGIDPGSQIVWAPNSEILSGQGTTSITAAPPANTTYTVAVTSPTGCSWNGQATVSISPINGSGVSASADPSIVPPGETVQLLATPSTGVSYSWVPPDSVSNPNIANPTANPTVTTTYWVTVTDGVCTRLDSVTVKVQELNCEEPDIFVPNAFTPNADGNNDTLYVRGRFISELEFRIFDRWGEQMFETSNKNLGWDGTFKDKPVEPAVYVYYLDAACPGGQKYFKKGNITVIR